MLENLPKKMLIKKHPLKYKKHLVKNYQVN